MMNRYFVATFTIFATPLSSPAHSSPLPPAATYLRSTEAASCEVWIDKAAAEVVAYDAASGPIFRTRIYVKVDTRQIPLASLAQVSWHGRELTWQGDSVVHSSDFQTEELRLLETARDYFVLDLGSLAEQTWNRIADLRQRVSHEGAFVVTTNDRRIWVNDGLRPSVNFAFDESLESMLRAKGQTLGSYGLAAKQSLEQVDRTADVLHSLNPHRCR